jgi:hypothetical protein
VCISPNKAVILSEALRRSIATEGFMARIRRTPAVLTLPKPLGAFQPSMPPYKSCGNHVMVTGAITKSSLQIGHLSDKRHRSHKTYVI